MLAAAMDRVLAEQAGAKETYPHYVGQAQGASIDVKNSSPDALIVRRCIWLAPAVVNRLRAMRGRGTSRPRLAAVGAIPRPLT